MKLAIAAIALAATMMTAAAHANECVKRCENSCYNHDRECPSSYQRGSAATEPCLAHCRFQAASQCEQMCYVAMLDRRGKTECLRACNDGVSRSYYRALDGQLYVQR